MYDLVSSRLTLSLGGFGICVMHSPAQQCTAFPDDTAGEFRLFASHEVPNRDSVAGGDV